MKSVDGKRKVQNELNWKSKLCGTVAERGRFTNIRTSSIEFCRTA